jgi:DNA-binding response OmpR family regulator
MSYRECFPVFVEDDDDFAVLLKRAFMKAGVPGGNIQRYRDGEAALSALESIEVPMPSVMTLDIELPGMSGLSVLKEIRARKPFLNLPAFVLSGREDQAHVTQAYAVRANGYWVKPCGTWELQEIVTAIMDFYLEPGSRELPRCLPNPWTP